MVGQNVGKYKILDKIGRGGMGTVYRAIDETLHRDVAIKVLNAELNDPEVAKRFRAEAITVARLSHPGIATIYELFEHEGEWLMVMEFVRGETLESMVSRMGPLSAQRAAELCMQTLAALAHAHSMGVVHRDLKPANVMITENGAVKVMDFGIARVSGSEHLTNAGFMMGTPAYMAPEQVRGGDSGRARRPVRDGRGVLSPDDRQAAVQRRHGVFDGAVAGERSADAGAVVPARPAGLGR